MKKKDVIIITLVVLGICLIVSLCNYTVFKKDRNSDDFQIVNGVVIKKENRGAIVKLEESVNEKNTITVNDGNYNINDILY